MLLFHWEGKWIICIESPNVEDLQYWVLEYDLHRPIKSKRFILIATVPKKIVKSLQYFLYSKNSAVSTAFDTVSLPIIVRTDTNHCSHSDPNPTGRGFEGGSKLQAQEVAHLRSMWCSMRSKDATFASLDLVIWLVLVCFFRFFLLIID